MSISRKLFVEGRSFTINPFCAFGFSLFLIFMKLTCVERLKMGLTSLDGKPLAERLEG